MTQEEMKLCKMRLLIFSSMVKDNIDNRTQKYLTHLTIYIYIYIYIYIFLKSGSTYVKMSFFKNLSLCHIFVCANLALIFITL
jgi:hypothetical protein